MDDHTGPSCRLQLLDAVARLIIGTRTVQKNIHDVDGDVDEDVDGDGDLQFS